MKERGMRMGLVGRVLVSAGVPTLVAVAAFAAMVFSITELRAAQTRAADSQRTVIAAEALSRAVGDVRAGVPEAAAAVRAAAGKLAGEHSATREIGAAARRYAADPDESGRASFVAELDQFLTAEQDAVAADQGSADAATQRAVTAAVIGLVASIVAMAGLGVYLTRVVTLPVRRAGEVAREFADGHLEVRLPATGAGEIRDLQTALNDMASSLAGARSELAASRSRIAAAEWQSRRELERNLHDGLQQRLVSLALDVRALAADLPSDRDGLRAQTDRLTGGLNGAVEELREIARGIQPAVLTGSGLKAALRTLARRSALPVEVDVDLPVRPPADIESAAYYFTAEAITNTIKHAGASYVGVAAHVTDGCLEVVVTDDGVGGATAGGGSGLVGLRDRIEAAGGSMSVVSEPGHGTTLTARLPIGFAAG